MSGLNPAFISQQLGHRAQKLLSTYARWINSSSDWSELESSDLVSHIGIGLNQRTLSY